MSHNFFASEIFILDDHAIGTCLDGYRYFNPDFPIDTVLCIDDQGYVCKAINLPVGDPSKCRDPLVWPRRCREGIPLSSQHWVQVYHPDNIPKGLYYTSIAEAPFTSVMPPYDEHTASHLKSHNPDDFWN